MAMTHRPPPRGYALLLGVVLLTAMLTISLAITTLLIRQLGLAGRVVAAAEALAVADSGVEKALYVDFHGGLANGQVINSTDSLPPYGDSTDRDWYTVSVVITDDPPATSINSIGHSAGSQRAFEVDY